MCAFSVHRGEAKALYLIGSNNLVVLKPEYLCVVCSLCILFHSSILLHTLWEIFFIVQLFM